MASGYPGDTIRQINRLFLDGTTAALTDGQLLERFTTRRAEAAEAAFEALISRHGPMVLRVVRGVLRDPHDVEDAFQATFLVLVRKARSIGERDLLGPWLYGVAHRVALKARTVAAKRNKREGGAFDDPPADLNEGPWLDLRPVLHEELNRLPEKYRKPVILCHLQGLTHSEAAQELAWPVGTVSVRLARARKLLKERLTRRGLTVTASLWAAGLSLESASAAVPQLLIHSTTKAALAFAAGRSIAAGVVSAGAMALTRSTLTMMFVSRLKWIAAPMLLGTCTAGAFVYAQGTPGTQVPPGATPPGASKPEDPRVAGQVEVTNLRNPNEFDSVPPGYFDITSLATKDASGPAIVRPGQTLEVELLEALPGRPLTGTRLVRPDGTISLGFYGDLEVAGWNRKQIKVKLIEHMRKYVNDEVLGLMQEGPDGKIKAVPPLESNRVFVDDSGQPNRFSERSLSYKPDGPTPISPGQTILVEVLKTLPGRPITGERVVRPDGTISLGFYGDLQVAGLDRNQAKVKLIEHLRKHLSDQMLGLKVRDQAPVNRDKAIFKTVEPADSTSVFVDDTVSYLPRPKAREGNREAGPEELREPRTSPRPGPRLGTAQALRMQRPRPPGCRESLAWR
jgi:polysaccharide biosynthesis/export protein